NATASGICAWHMRRGKRWGKLFPPPDDHSTLIPRQFACSIEPDPMRSLPPMGRRQAPRPAYRTALREIVLGRALFESHDELARTVPTVPYRSRLFPPALRYNVSRQLFAR